MTQRTRRELFTDVGQGMLLAGLGGAAASLGVPAAWADDDAGRLTFGKLEPLVSLMQENAPDKLLPKIVEKLKSGTALQEVVAAAALANARAFGGEDYVGFHTLMALAPAYRIALEETDERRRPLAVLKVLHRHSARLQERGSNADTLKPVVAASEPATGAKLRDAIRRRDAQAAETGFAALPADGLLDPVMLAVDDDVDVHRVVLVSRSLDLLPFVGADRAHALLRQSVRYCLKSEANDSLVKRAKNVRDMLPRILEKHRLLERDAGTRPADDARIEELVTTLLNATPEQAADAAAAMLAEGFLPDAVGEALAVAANQLVLRDEGRPAAWAQKGKPEGSCHGDSVGVHACDSVNAWRTLAGLGDRRTRATSLVLGAFQVARDRSQRSAEFAKWQPYPRPEHLAAAAKVSAGDLLPELAAAVKAKEQGRAAALARRLGDAGTPAPEVFAVLRGFAISEDGALHGEKYYRTAVEEYARARPAFRWRQVEALARVTASAAGQPAPGVANARQLLGV